MEPSPHSTDSQPPTVLGAPDVPQSRRRHHGQTGPRTALGKRRASVNGMRRGLCPPWIARDLRARGEDVKPFARLHGNLIARLSPEDARTRMVVEAVAEAFWEKLRFARNTRTSRRRIQARRTTKGRSAVWARGCGERSTGAISDDRLRFARCATNRERNDTDISLRMNRIGRFQGERNDAVNHLCFLRDRPNFPGNIRSQRTWPDQIRN
jgi:hypothetical protein